MDTTDDTYMGGVKLVQDKIGMKKATEFFCIPWQGFFFAFGSIQHMGAGNKSLSIDESTYLRIKLITAAGPVELPEPVEVLILEEDNDELLVGQDVLLALGIDVDRQLEQLSRQEENEDEEDIELLKQSYAKSQEDFARVNMELNKMKSIIKLALPNLTDTEDAQIILD